MADDPKQTTVLFGNSSRSTTETLSKPELVDDEDVDEEDVDEDEDADSVSDDSTAEVAGSFEVSTSPVILNHFLYYPSDCVITSLCYHSSYQPLRLI